MHVINSWLVIVLHVIVFGGLLQPVGKTKAILNYLKLFKTRLFTASLFTHAKEMQAWGTRGGGVGFTSEASKKNLFLGLHPILSRVFRFALASSSLAILSARSTIKFKKYEKIEGCEETNLKPPLVTWGAFHSNAFERKFPWKVSERIEMVAFRNRNHSIENSWNFRMENQIQWKFTVRNLPTIWVSFSEIPNNYVHIYFISYILHANAVLFATINFRKLNA